MIGKEKKAPTRPEEPATDTSQKGGGNNVVTMIRQIRGGIASLVGMAVSKAEERMALHPTKETSWYQGKRNESMLCEKRRGIIPNPKLKGNFPLSCSGGMEGYRKREIKRRARGTRKWNGRTAVGGLIRNSSRVHQSSTPNFCWVERGGGTREDQNVEGVRHEGGELKKKKNSKQSTAEHQIRSS